MQANKLFWYIVAISFIIAAIFTQNSVDSGNDASRIASIQSLVEQGTFAIDDTSFNVTNHELFNDKIMYKGHFYSSKPPMGALLGVVPYAFFHYLFGLQFNDFFQPSAAYYLTTLFSMGVLYSLLNGFFFLYMSRKKNTVKHSLLLTASLGLGTLVFTYMGVYNNHLPSLSLLFISFYLLSFYNEFTHPKYHLALAGFLMGVAICIEPPIIILASFVLLIIQQKRKETPRISIALGLSWILLAILDKASIFLLVVLAILVWNWKYSLEFFKNNYVFIMGIVLTLLAYALMNYAIIESPLPQHLHPDHKSFYDYPGGPWPNGDPTGRIPDGEYLLHSTIGYRGIFSYSPILLISLVGLYYALRGRKQRNQALIFGFATLAFFAYYVFDNSNYGGYSYGNRRLIAISPFLLLFNQYYIQKHAKNKNNMMLYYILLGVSIVFALIGVYEPWADIYGYEIFYNQPIPLLNNLKNFIQGIFRI